MNNADFFRTAGPARGRMVFRARRQKRPRARAYCSCSLTAESIKSDRPGNIWFRSSKSTSQGGRRLRFVSTTFILFFFWLLLSGHFTAFLIGAGLVSAVAVVLFARRMDVVDHEGHPVHLAPRAVVSYWPWLLMEIVKSAWDVSKIIVQPRLPISPTILSVKCTQKTDLGRTVFANSITLTPGTISVEVRSNEILVHALTRSAADGLAEGEMDRRVSALERAL